LTHPRLSFAGASNRSASSRANAHCLFATAATSASISSCSVTSSAPLRRSCARPQFAGASLCSHPRSAG
jgi:hypothetical protein